MKVFIVLQSLTQGGTEKQLLQVAKTLKRDGIEPVILTYSKALFYKEVVVSHNIEVRVCPFRSKIRRVLWIRKNVQHDRPISVLAAIKAPAVYSLLALTFQKPPRLVLTWRFNDPKLLKGMFGKLISIYNKRVSCVVCNSESGSKLWLDSRPEDSKKIRTIYNIVDRPTVSPKPYRQDYSRIEILVLARIQPIKNADKLVEAIRLLSDSDKKRLHISWYGDASSSNTEYRDRVIASVHENHLDDTISFYEASQDIVSLIERTDFVALFSESEGFPNAICEGMIAGRAIIMSKVSDYYKMINDNGFVIEDTSPSSIANTLHNVAGLSLNEIFTMCEKSKDIANSLFSNAENEEKWKEILTCTNKGIS